MDTISIETISSVINALVQAGASAAFADLRARLTRKGRRNHADKISKLIDERGSFDPGRAGELATVLAEAAQDSTRARELISEWLGENTRPEGRQVNLVTGTVKGSVIQANTIGTVSL